MGIRRTIQTNEILETIDEKGINDSCTKKEKKKKRPPKIFEGSKFNSGRKIGGYRILKILTITGAYSEVFLSRRFEYSESFLAVHSKKLLNTSNNWENSF